MKEFAIKAYLSPEHQWWFRPHPPAPCNTRTVLPRFQTPVETSARADKRPLVVYAKMLNQMSDDEWCARGLDKAVCATPMPNIQLAHCNNAAALERYRSKIASTSKIVVDILPKDTESPPPPHQFFGTDFVDPKLPNPCNFNRRIGAAHLEYDSSVYYKETSSVRGLSMTDLFPDTRDVLSRGQPNCDFLPPSVPWQPTRPTSPTRRTVSL